ncbi:MAG: hypothetical protein AB4040_18450 [Synechococcus sp.]
MPFCNGTVMLASPSSGERSHAYSVAGTPSSAAFYCAHILQAVDGYNPETDVILLLESGDGAPAIRQATAFVLPPLPTDSAPQL